MSLSAIAGATPAPPSGSAGGGARPAGSDDGFSRMLQGGAQKTPAVDGTPSPETRPADRDGGNRRVEGNKRDATQQESADTRASRATAADEEPAAGETAAAGITDTTADTAGADAGADAAGQDWPPPGLASLLTPVTLGPVAAAANPAAAATAAGQAQALAQGTRPGDATPAAARPLLATATRPAEPATTPTPASADGAAGLLALGDAGAGATPEPAPAAGTSFLLHAAPTATLAIATGTTPATVSAPHAPTPHLHGEAFADDLGTQVQWLAGQKISHAHIRISPQELGPVEIRLQLDGDRISADFSSAQPEVRQALESSLPRLRDMLGQQGFELAHAGVGQQSRQDGGGTMAGRNGTGDGTGEATDEAATRAPVRVVHRGLLDAYA